MRCPKCGYITFDHLEICTKCKKEIAAASEQLSGTVFKAEAPAFLQFAVRESDSGNEVSDDLLQEDKDIDLEFPMEGKEIDDSLDNDDLEFDFLDDGQDVPASQGDVEGDEFDLALFDDESDELDLDEEDTAVTGGEDAPQLDFSELDISDLAPPDDDDDDLSLAELTLDDVTDRPVAREENSGQPLMGTGAGLEDLHVDDLDLEIPSLPPAGSVTGKKMRPSVKTGTALDGFDIDLGELMSDQEK
jgi:hypothetical protein